MNNEKQNKLVAVYGRVSSSHQEEEGTIQTQLSAISSFVQDRGYIVVQTYTDEGWSGDSIVRPNLDQLRMDAKKKMWEAVIFYDPDRIARRYSYQELIMDELREAGVEVIFVTTPAPKNPVEKILYGVQGLFAEYERAKITERFRIGKVRKASEGHIIVSEAPYGYTFILKKGKRGDSDFKQGYYEINEREAQIVKNLFDWVANEGLTLRAIVRRLQTLGIPPRKSTRGVWNTSTLSTLLRNKTYIGEGHYGASYAVVPVNPLKKDGYKKIKKTSRRSRPEDEWIKIVTPKLIEEDVFNLVQEKLRSNFEQSTRNTKNEYLLSHRIWCPCGCRRAGEGPMKGKHLYYRCTDRVKSFPLKSTCIEKGLDARIVDQAVWKELSRLMCSPELLRKQSEKWIKNENQQVKGSTINITETEKEIEKLNKQEDRFANAYGVGAISLEQFKEYTAPLKEKVSVYQNQISQAKREEVKVNYSSLPTTEEILTFTETAFSALSDLNFGSKQAIVRSVIEKVIGTRTELDVFGYIPININVFTFNRYRWSSKRGEIHPF